MAFRYFLLFLCHLSKVYFKVQRPHLVSECLMDTPGSSTGAPFPPFDVIKGLRNLKPRKVQHFFDPAAPSFFHSEPQIRLECICCHLSRLMGLLQCQGHSKTIRKSSKGEREEVKPGRTRVNNIWQPLIGQNTWRTTCRTKSPTLAHASIINGFFLLTWILRTQP